MTGVPMMVAGPAIELRDHDAVLRFAYAGEISLSEDDYPLNVSETPIHWALVGCCQSLTASRQGQAHALEGWVVDDAVLP